MEDQGQRVDICEEFKEACKSALVPGELLHGSWFSLQYAIFAIEIMDPKLDARCQNRRKVPTLRESIVNNMLITTEFQDKHILIGIIDELLCCYVNWINGDFLSQTIFTCMYMHCTQLIEDDNLVLFCESLRMTVFYILELIKSASVYEEEDFYPSTNGMTLSGPDPRFDSFNETSKSFDQIFRDADSKKILYTTLEKLLDDKIAQLSNGNEDWQLHLSIRFKYIKNLLFIMNNLYKLKMDQKIVGMFSNLSLDEQKPKEVFDIKAVIGDCCSVTNDILANAHELLVTFNAGLEASDGKLDPQNKEYGIPGFELLLNTSKQPASIPRTVRIIPRKEGFIYLTEQAQRFKNVIVFFMDLFKGKERISKFALYKMFQKLNQLEARKMNEIIEDSEKLPTLQIAGGCILSRSICRLVSRVILGENDQIESNVKVSSILQLWSDIDPFIKPEHIEKVREKKLNAEIISHCDQLMNNIINIFCYNTSRQYTSMKNIIKDYMENCGYWSCLDSELFAIYSEDPETTKIMDQEKPHFVFFMLYFFYHIIWNFIVQGFYMDIYACSEMSIIYGFLLNHLRNLNGSINHYCTEMETIQARFQKLNPRNKEVLEKSRDLIFTFRAEICYTSVHMRLVSATMMTYLAILKDAGLNLNCEPVDSDRKKPTTSPTPLNRIHMKVPRDNHIEIFYRRFGPILDVPILFPKDSCGKHNGYNYINKVGKESFEKYSSQEMYTHAEGLFRACRETLTIIKTGTSPMATEMETMLKLYCYPSQSDNLEDLIQLTKRNSIAVNLLAKCPDKRPQKTLIKPATSYFPYKGSPVSLDFRQISSRSYPVINLQNKIDK